MDVWIHGAGVITPFGVSWRGLADRLRSGETRTAIEDIPDPGPARQKKMMSRAARLAAVALAGALDDAGIEDADDVAYFLGVGASACPLEDLDRILEGSIEGGAFSVPRFGDRGLLAANPLIAFHLMNNFTLCHGAIQRGVTGPNAAFFSRGAGTVHALAEAMNAVRSGSRFALAGGADSAHHPVTVAELTRERFVGQGFVPGEGAAVVAIGAEPGVARVESVTIGSVEDAGADVVVASVWSSLAFGEPRSLAQLYEEAPRVVEVSPAIGDALAASPALAWAVGLDLVRAAAKRVQIVTVGVDGVPCSVLLDSTGQSQRRHRASPKRRAVVTGVGVVSPFGVGADVFLDALAAGASAVRPVASFPADTFPTRVAAEVPEVPTVDDLPRGAERDRKIAFGFTAATEAVRDAGVDMASASMSIALGLERALLEDFVPAFDGRIDWPKLSAGPAGSVQLRSRVDLLLQHLRMAYAVRGHALANVSACAAGASAFLTAASWIERGEADVVLCGGADSMINPMGLGGMSRLNAPSPRAAPDACRPFDKRRDGLVIGEGSAMFVLESEAHARARGAKIRAVVLGHASTQDGYRATAPRPDGSMASRAIRRAVEAAGSPAVDWINAHGTGTPLNDPAEAKAIVDALGADIPVSSIKGAIGHLMAASGAIEIAGCLLPFERGVVFGTAHLETIDPACPLDVVGPAPRTLDVDTVLTTSFGFGGQNAAVVLGRPT